METIISSLDSKFNSFLTQQLNIESAFCKVNKKNNGVFLTNNSFIIDAVLENVPNDITILSKTFLEPSCGQGIFLIKLIIKAYLCSPKAFDISKFIQDKLYFVDIDAEMIETTKINISSLFLYLFKNKYKGNFNCCAVDFTKLDDISTPDKDRISNLSQKIDFVVGNPPYITLYGRRDKKKNEQQRIYYLNNYSQFPLSLKNGKINYVMLFIERGLSLLKEKGALSFVIDISFFETAYMHCRKYIVENYTIESLIYNIQGFDGVASGQIILRISNKMPQNNSILVINKDANKKVYIKQDRWNKPDDEYKFRISHCNKSDIIIEKLFNKKDPTLKDIYPKKNLRTCVMLLNMEEQFTSNKQSESVQSYPYYRGSNGLKYKYSKLNHLKIFNYDTELQNKINDTLKAELTLKGVKNKKRIGLGETVIYDNPKVYIRQSARELIASFDENPSSANNSLYVFSLRDDSKESIVFLKYLCGLMNSTIYSFFAQQRRIIRYNKGKQPQIKISDLYQIFIPQDNTLKEKIATLVDNIYRDSIHVEKYKKEIDLHLYSYYGLCSNEIKTINNSIKSFIQ
ncbi:MAG: hypothetical protein HFP77_04765 [Methylococcales symbiont of Iophon sp. n. MRB-2018]|nr:MAG: hypothetical protein HFP77_04765 [Methylococcales symbiont of Iophon sp. n. MRB-2018]KAF3979942.1 MAG: hypothetical protein HFP76_04735 [Methylococcales symbiont of Iophon sp. n. MRB-2018]